MVLEAHITWIFESGDKIVLIHYCFENFFKEFVVFFQSFIYCFSIWLLNEIFLFFFCSGLIDFVF